MASGVHRAEHRQREAERHEDAGDVAGHQMQREPAAAHRDDEAQPAARSGQPSRPAPCEAK